jgi:hypothetical protein
MYSSPPKCKASTAIGAGDSAKFQKPFHSAPSFPNQYMRPSYSNLAITCLNHDSPPMLAHAAAHPSALSLFRPYAKSLSPRPLQRGPHQSLRPCRDLDGDYAGEFLWPPHVSPLQLLSGHQNPYFLLFRLARPQSIRTNPNIQIPCKP